MIEEFNEYRRRMNERIMQDASLNVKRFWAVDERAYEPGALSAVVKELMGLCASLVLRCDDCVKYHLQRAVELDASDAQINETMEIALVVGGSVVIPHLRRAYEFRDACRNHKTFKTDGDAG
ncbi:MAG: carboxymuconolactone decarboxylase family protein [Bacteroidia bacterium]|nr:carboxymuconolactone decarboxylase family protein [Bacteroidia bacterium]MDW8334889.1 carboxymuconolactone decarboxylase family protein [Bacteroidia bacterium]